MLKLLDISKFKESTNIIYGLTKSDEKSDLRNLHQMKIKLKMYCKVGIEVSINDITKSLKYTLCLSSLACHKKIVEFTDSTHIIY